MIIWWRHPLNVYFFPPFFSFFVKTISKNEIKCTFKVKWHIKYFWQSSPLLYSGKYKKKILRVILINWIKEMSNSTDENKLTGKTKNLRIPTLVLQMGFQMVNQQFFMVSILFHCCTSGFPDIYLEVFCSEF